MRTMNRFDAIALACVLLGCEARATRAEPPGRDRPSSPAAAPAEPLDYVERCVASTCDASLPTLVVIHGLGDRPEAFVELFLQIKRENGYSESQIDRKRMSLEGVLVPVTARWNEELLHQEGFASVDCFWRHLNFAGWVAVKP